MTDGKRERVRMLAYVYSPTLSIIKPTFRGAAMKGEGDTDYVCSACDSVLMQGMRKGQVVGVGIQCFDCGVVSMPPVL